jgi:hypothetical protein
MSQVARPQNQGDLENEATPPAYKVRPRSRYWMQDYVTHRMTFSSACYASATLRSAFKGEVLLYVR